MDAAAVDDDVAGPAADDAVTVGAGAAAVCATGSVAGSAHHSCLRRSVELSRNLPRIV
jgi:hypothetical protein